MAYKFNNARGAIICDDCRIIIKEPASNKDHKEAGDFCSAETECAQARGKMLDKLKRDLLEVRENFQDGLIAADEYKAKVLDTIIVNIHPDMSEDADLTEALVRAITE